MYRVNSIKSRSLGIQRARLVHLFTLGCIVIFSACSFITGSSKKRIGILRDSGGVEKTLQVPNKITAGQDAAFTITTLGSGCMIPDGAEIRVSGLTADIEPHDRLPAGPCEMVERRLPRVVTLHFASPGIATIRVKGIDLVGQPVVVETHVVVDP